MFENSPIAGFSEELEQEAINRFRQLTAVVPLNCHIFRRIDDRVITLYLDFRACPQELSVILKNYTLLARVSHQLGLANSLVFTLGKRIIGWTNLTKND